MRAVQVVLRRLLSFAADSSREPCAASAWLPVSFFFPAALPKDRIPRRPRNCRCWIWAAATGTRFPDQRARRERDLLRLQRQPVCWRISIEWFWGLPPLEPPQGESAR